MKLHSLAAAVLALSSLSLAPLPALAATPAETSANAAAISNQAVASPYAVLVCANYSDTLAAATDMQNAITAFVKAPSV